MIIEPFQGPRLHVKRCRDNAAELEHQLAKIEKRLKYYFIEAPDNETSNIYCFQFDEEPPPEMALVFREGLNNLRVALDISICDAARVCGKPENEMERVKFPFAKDEPAYKKTVSSMKLPEDLKKVIKSLHPLYIESNRWLDDLHQLDIISKHRNVLPVFAMIEGRNPFQIPEEHAQFMARSIGINPNGMSITWRHGSLLILKSDDDPRGAFQVCAPLDLTLPNDLPLGGQSIRKILKNYAMAIDSLIDSFIDLFSPA